MAYFSKWLSALTFKLGKMGAPVHVAKPSPTSYGLPLDEKRLIDLASRTPSAEDKRAALLEPFTYTASQNGNDTLRKILEAFNVWLKVPEDKLKIIRDFVDVVHITNLMDGTIGTDPQSPGGSQVAHQVYGKAQTTNAAKYALFIAHHELLALQRDMSDPSRLLVILTEELLSLHRGLGLDVVWRDMARCPTEEEYISNLDQKNGLFRLGIKLMVACANANQDVDYLPLINMIGSFYQIRDDYMDLQITESSENKPFAMDISNGKFTFPIIHSIQYDQTNRHVLSVLQKHPTTPTLKIHTIERLRNQTKSLDYTLSFLDKRERQMREEITRLGGNRVLETLMDSLHVHNN